MAAPTVRGSKVCAKANGSSITGGLAVPAGTVSGDLLVLLIIAETREAVFPTLTLPSGWTLRSSGQCNEAGFQRTAFVITRVCAGEANLPTIEVSNTCVNLTGACTSITTGTFNPTSPVNVAANFVEVAGATTSHGPAVTTTVPECLALMCTASPGTVKEPEAGWAILENTINATTGQAIIDKAISTATPTGEPTYKKVGSKASLTAMVAIAPFSYTATTTMSAKTTGAVAVKREASRASALAAKVVGATAFHAPGPINVPSIMRAQAQLASTLSRSVTPALPKGNMLVQGAVNVEFPIVNLMPFVALPGETTNTGKNVQIKGGNLPEAMQFTPANSGYVRKIRMRPNSTLGTGGRISMAICKDNEYAAGKHWPGEVIAVGEVTENPTSGVWFSIPMAGVGATKGFILAGRIYWEVITSEVAFNTIFASSGGGTVLQRGTKTVNLSTELGATVWTEGSVSTDNNGRMNTLIQGSLAPEWSVAMSSAAKLLTVASRSVSVSVAMRAAVTKRTEEEPEVTVIGGGRIKAKLRAAVVGAAFVARTIARAVAMSATGELEAEAIGGAAKLNVYYGPAGEEAAEKARREAGEGSRYLNAYPAAKPGAPTVVFVHGGGWEAEQWESKNPNVKGIVEALVKAGLTVFSIDYRVPPANPLSSDARFPAAEDEDVRAATAYAVAHAEAFNGNPNHLVLFGGSAGGHLVARAAMLLQPTIPVAAVICASGIFDLVTMMKEMEEEVYRDPHAGGSASNLTEHAQMFLQQTLGGVGGAAAAAAPAWVSGGTYTPGQMVTSAGLTWLCYVEVVAGTTTPQGDKKVHWVEYPYEPGKTDSTTGPARAVQATYSPARQTMPAGSTKWMLLNYESDLIERNQPIAMRERLEADGRWDAARSIYKIVPATEAVPSGHAFSYWGSKWGEGQLKTNELVKDRILAFIGAVEVTASMSAVARGATAVSRTGRQSAALAAKVTGGASIGRNQEPSRLSSTIRGVTVLSRVAQETAVLRAAVAGVASVRRSIERASAMQATVTGTTAFSTKGYVKVVLSAAVTGVAGVLRAARTSSVLAAKVAAGASVGRNLAPSRMGSTASGVTVISRTVEEAAVMRVTLSGAASARRNVERASAMQTTVAGTVAFSTKGYLKVTMSAAVSGFTGASRELPANLYFTVEGIQQLYVDTNIVQLYSTIE